MKIKISEITNNPEQPRRTFPGINELAASIKAVGLLEPIMVRPHGDGYQIIHGERRLRAMSSLGADTIPAIVREATDEEVFEIAVVENVQREDLTPMEEALALKRLAAAGRKQKEIGKLVGLNQSQVATKIRFLKLPEKTLELWNSKKISEGHAKQILRLQDPADQVAFTDEIMSRDMTVSKLKRDVDFRIDQLEAIEKAKEQNIKNTLTLSPPDDQLLVKNGVECPYSDFWYASSFRRCSSRMGGTVCLIIYMLETALNRAAAIKDIKTVAVELFPHQIKFEMELYIEAMARTVSSKEDADLIFIDVSENTLDQAEKIVAGMGENQICMVRTGPYKPSFDDSFRSFFDLLRRVKGNEQISTGHALASCILDEPEEGEQVKVELSQEILDHPEYFGVINVVEYYHPVFMSRDMFSKWNHLFIPIEEMI